MMTDASLPLTRVIVVEDQRMFRGFLERWLEDDVPRMVLAGSFGSGEEALARLDQAEPDVMLVDLDLPGIDGLEFVRRARQIRPQTRTLILTSMTDALALTRIRESAVEGYIDKAASLEELQTAVTTIAAGKSHYSPRMAATLRRETERADALGKILSRREQQVLAHILAGRTSREIGGLLDLSGRTVEFHRANIMAKLGATGVTDLLARARQHGLG